MKSRNQRIFALLSILAGIGMGYLWPAEAGAAGTAPISLSGAVYHGNEPDLGLTDFWLATLSKQATIKVLERADMRAILGELSLAGVSDDSARQVRLGRLLGVEYFAWIKASDDQALLEVVEAATGRGIAVIPVRFAKGHFADILPKLAEQAAQAVSKPPPAPSQVAPSLAFSNPRFSTSNEAVQAAVEKVMADLSGAWAGSGITMLPRRFAADAVQERWRQEKGLVEDTSQGQAFLGADYILGVAVDATNRIELIMVETATGRRLGKKEMPLEVARTTEGLKTMKEWGLDRLKPLMKTPSILPPAAVTNNHYASPEILKSLYAGMVLHNQGRYIDALIKFREAQSRQKHLNETFNWITSCYRLAGFPEVAEGLISFANHVSTRNVIIFGQSLFFKGPTLMKQSAPGVILLGVTAGTGMPRGLAERMGMLLIDRLHETAGVTVLASADIAGLRDEYDLLMGLEKIKGTTWRKAPPILVQNAVTAHLEPDNAGIRLRLCMIRDCNPTSIYDAVTTLPPDHAQWPDVIDKSIRLLLARKNSTATKWSPPPVIVDEKQSQLLEQLDLDYDRSDNTIKAPLIDVYLKALTRDPTLTKYRSKIGWCDEQWRLSLERWFLRVLPKEHPERPIMEFAIATLPFERYQDDPLPSVMPESRSEFKLLSDKYPSHIIGLFARYNMVLIDMTPTNFAATQEQIDRLLLKMKGFERQEYAPAINRIRIMNSALRCVLGLSSDQAVDVIYNSGCRLVTIGHIEKRDMSLYESGVLWGRQDFFLPRTTNHTRVDLEAACFLRKGAIPASFLLAIIQKEGIDADITQYAVLKYFSAALLDPYIMREWTDEDLIGICPAFVDIFKKVQKRDQKSISIFYANAWRDRFPKNKVATDARLKFQDAIQAAFPATFTNRFQGALDDVWRLGPLKDRSRHDLRGMDPTHCFDYYVQYLDRLHALYDNEPKSHIVCRMYYQFGKAFLLSGRHDLAEPLFEQIVSWRDYKDRPPETSVYAASLYCLAWLKHRRGDIPESLRWAKKTLDYIETNPQIDFRGVYNHELKPEVIDFIKRIRETPVK